MDYYKLAEQFLNNTHRFQKCNPKKKIDSTMRGENFVIIFIGQQGRSVLPSELSNATNISSARIAATLNSLEKKGLITRQIDLSDRRRILVDLTPAGRELSEQHRQKAIEATVQILMQLGEHDAKEFVRIMGRFSEIAPKHLPPM